MSEPWMGLHNEQWHQGYSLALNATRCENPRRGACFDEWCAPDKPCRCCLAAEVEVLRKERDALRASVQRVRELHREIDGWTSGPTWCESRCESTSDGDPTFYPCSTIRALDGGDDD